MILKLALSLAIVVTATLAAKTALADSTPWASVASACRTRSANTDYTEYGGEIDTTAGKQVFLTCPINYSVGAGFNSFRLYSSGSSATVGRSTAILFRQNKSTFALTAVATVTRSAITPGVSSVSINSSTFDFDANWYFVQINADGTYGGASVQTVFAVEIIYIVP